MIRAKQIQDILARRKPLVERIKRIETTLENMQGLCTRFVHEAETFKRDLDTDKIQKINGLQQGSSEIKSEISYQLGRLDKLRSRFSRQTLNIGVIGLARQGKSRLLQALTGLGPEEIPDGNRTDCTGVRSSITNSQNAVSARVSFYTASSFLDEVISPYYVNLGLGPKPLSLEEFAASPLPGLPGEKEHSAVAKAQYLYLKRYHEFYPKYRSLLDEEPRQISRDQIREYVSQSSVLDGESYHNFFVVKEVQIQCPFPASDVNQICFVDMPGLGDTGLGNEERLLQVLAHEVDLLFVVRMPAPSGDSWNETDILLYDTCARAVDELFLKDWAFMVLNRTRTSEELGDNLANCKDLQEQIQNKGTGFSRVMTVDGSNQEEVRQELLDPALEYLTNSIETIDGTYVQKKHEQLVEIRKKVQRLFARATPEEILGAE